MNKFKQKLSLVPNLPGSYQMKNKDGNIIYVGKAKNLKKRLSSYFNRVQTGKTLLLVNDIYDFEYIVTDTEIESLILEITLIKKYNPKYNILLKDDKSYPYIEFIEKPYPSLNVVRNVKRKKNKNKLFGPYPNVNAAKKTVEMLNRIYPLKKCRVTPKKECLYYHLGECLGYCIKSNEELDLSFTKEVLSFLRGNHDFITKKIQEEMNKASDSLNYEKALELKNMLENIKIVMSKQKIDLNSNSDFDLINYYYEDNYLSIVIFFIRGGLLFGKDSNIFEYYSTPEESVYEYVINFYNKGIIPKTVLVNENIDDVLLSNYLNTKVIVPKKGKLKHLLDMTYDNAKTVLDEKLEIIKRNDLEREKAIKDLESLLGYSKIERIEAFDNSHLFGTFYVGGMVVFDNFLPNKDEYRKFKIATDVKDDLSAMKEVIYRRYFRVMMDNLKKPDLIIVDGGRNQVAVAKEIIDSLKLDIKVIGLAKDDKHKTSIIINSDLKEVVVDKRSNLFLFLNRIQDEVHRYAITYHRSIKSKGMLSSILDLVPGVGEVSKKKLLKEFGSLKKIKEATLEELGEVIPKPVAKNLYEYLKEVER